MGGCSLLWATPHSQKKLLCVNDLQYALHIRMSVTRPTPQAKQTQHSEASSNPESPVTRSGDSGDGISRPTVRKDRSCPFCHQPFTSSSLGRHLDLYIKDKNPKAADGIHDVDQIRKLRGKITRRHARVSSSAVNGLAYDSRSPTSGTLSSSKPQPLEPQNLAADPPGHRNSFSVDSSGRGPTAVNKLTWQNTGVINDLPPRASDLAPRANELPPRTSTVDSSDAIRLRPFLQHDWQRDREGRTAEVALKDILATIQAACARTQDSELFDFDAFALNFPALCFRMLTPPTTLYSTTPVSDSGSWPLEPPQEPELRVLLEKVQVITEKNMRVAQERNACLPNNPFSSGPAKFIDAIGKRASEHVEQSFSRWKALTPQEQVHSWQTELMRAFASEMDQVRDTKVSLEKTRQELDRVKVQLDAARDPQRTSQQTQGPAQLPQLPSSLANDLTQGNSDPNAWDYDNIMAKYRGFVSQKTELPGPSLTSPSSQRRNSRSGSNPFQPNTSRRQSHQSHGAPPATTSQASGNRRTDPSQAQAGSRRRHEDDTEMRDREEESEYSVRRSLGAG